MKLQRNTHHVYRLMYHFVWIPKYRHKVFEEPHRTVLKDIIWKIGYDYDIDIVELEVRTDHIHMVVRSEPKVYQRRSFSSYTLRLRRNILGEVSYEPKAIL